jgi:hypothetical protein
MEVSGQLHTLPPYPRGKILWYALDRSLAGQQNLSERYGKEKIAPAGSRTPTL